MVSCVIVQVIDAIQTVAINGTAISLLQLLSTPKYRGHAHVFEPVERYKFQLVCITSLLLVKVGEPQFIRWIQEMN
jgi:hypothetical protein